MIFAIKRNGAKGRRPNSNSRISLWGQQFHMGNLKFLYKDKSQKQGLAAFLWI